ncbi:MAG: hypothetical protein RL375_758 [Pseudomonadota bacterium]
MPDTKIVLSAVDRTAAAFTSAARNLQSLGQRALSVDSILGGLGVTLSAGAAFAWARNVATGIDALNDLQDATGASIENLSALEDIAGRTGTSFDTVGATVTKFNAVLKDAKPGSDAEAALQALNLNIKELQQLDPAEALRQTAVALAGFADDGAKARLVQELFGKSVREVAPFLKDLAEQGRLAGTVTTEQAKAAEEFNKQIFTLQKNILDLSRYLAGDLITSLNAAGNAMRTSGFVEGMAVLFGGTAQFKSDKRLTDQVDALMNLERALSNFRKEGYAEDSRAIKNVLAQIETVKEQVKITQGLRAIATPYDRSAERVRRQGATPLSVAFTGGTGKPTAARNEAVRAETNDLEVYIRSLERTLERTEDLSAVETARLRIAESLSRTSSVLMQKQALDLAQKIDAAKLLERENQAREKNNQMALAAVDALAAENEAIIASNQSLSDQVEEMGLTTQAVQELRLARLDAVIAADRELLVTRQNIEGGEAEAAQIERRINLRLRERALVESQGNRQVQIDADQLSKEAAQTLNADVKSALSNAFRDSKNPAQSFATGLGNVIYTRLTNSVASALADGLVGTGAPGSSGGLLGTLASSFLSFLPKFDTGIGYVPFDMPAIIHKGERVLTAEENRRGSGFAPSTSIVVQGGGNSGEIYANVSKALDARDRQWADRLKEAGVF